MEDNKNESGDSGQSKTSKRNAVIAGVSVGSGAILLATLMIGGTLLATNGYSGMYSIYSWFHARTTDAQRGNSLHWTAENSLPLPNF